MGWPLNADRAEIGTAFGKQVELELVVAYRVSDMVVFQFGEI